MREKLATIMATSLLLFVLVGGLPQPALARTRTPTPTPTPARPTPTPTPVPLFIDTASEGYPCSNGVCTFPSGNLKTSYAVPLTSAGGTGPTPYTCSMVAAKLQTGIPPTPTYAATPASPTSPPPTPPRTTSPPQ